MPWEYTTGHAYINIVAKTLAMKTTIYYAVSNFDSHERAKYLDIKFWKKTFSFTYGKKPCLFVKFIFLKFLIQLF